MNNSSINTSSPSSAASAVQATPPASDKKNDSLAYGDNGNNAYSTQNISSVGTTSVGVNATSAAINATGANPLVVDQAVNNSIAASPSTLPRNLSTACGPTPTISLASMQSNLTDLAADVDKISAPAKFLAAAASKVMARHGETSKKTKKADRKKDEAHDVKKGGKAADDSDSVSRSTNAQGETTTTDVMETTSASGTPTTTTSTTTMGGSSNSNASNGQSAGGTSNTQSEPVNSSSDEGEFSFTEIEDEIGSLFNQESQTLATQQTANVDAINSQASQTDNEAATMMNGAAAMMSGAQGSFSLGMAGSMVSLAGVGMASNAGDEADQLANQTANKELGEESENAVKNAATAHSTQDELTAIKASAEKLKKMANAPGIHPDVRTSVNDTAKHLDNFGNNVPIPQGESSHLIKAKASNATTQGHVSDLTSPSSLPETANDAERQAYNKEVAAKKAKLAKISINKNSQHWNNAFMNKNQMVMPFSTMANSASSFSGTTGQADSQIDSAEGKQDDAAAITDSATEQAVTAGSQASISLSGQLRSALASVGQAMAATVQSFHA